MKYGLVEIFVRAVAKGGSPRGFAAAKRHTLFLDELNVLGMHTGWPMRAVAKRLFLATPAGAPGVVLAFDDLHFKRAALGDVRRRHA